MRLGLGHSSHRLHTINGRRERTDDDDDDGK